MIGLLLGALAVGALACSGSSSSSSVARHREVTTYDLDALDAYERRSKYLGQKEKVEFFDYYREVDNYLARLIGEGSGGVGLLMNAIKFQKLNNYELRNIRNELKEIKDYRNNLAHNKDKWQNLPDPKSWYSSVLSKVKRLARNDETNVAHALFKQAQYSKFTRNH